MLSIWGTVSVSAFSMPVLWLNHFLPATLPKQNGFTTLHEKEISKAFQYGFGQCQSYGAQSRLQKYVCMCEHEGMLASVCIYSL